MSRHRSTGNLLATLALALVPTTARAICDVIPQPETRFRGETASLNRVYASPGEPVRIALDTTGCENGSTGFSAGASGGAASDFDDFTLQGWTPSGTHGTFNVQDLGIGPALFGDLVFNPQGQGALAPAAFLGDWAAQGVTQLSFIWAGLSTVDLNGSADVIRISGPGGSAAWRPSLGFLPALQGVLFSAPIDTSAPSNDWVLTSGTWAGLMGQVDELFLGGDLGFTFLEFGYSYVIDDVQLSANGSTGSVATLLFEPPSGPANAVIIPAGDSCGALASELAACQGQLGGGTAVCRDDLSPTVDNDSFLFPMPDQGFAGPATVAVSPQGAALPCDLATTACNDPGAPGGLLACIDTFYASDGTCDTDASNRHPQFPGLTVLPARNDFSDICGSANPAIPCSNSGTDVRFTTDADGNVVVPIDWQGVLVPGTLPIPRLVRASSSVAAFTGAPPEPTQTPGAPIEVPGLGFLQSFSPKGLRVDPVFNPLFNAASADTELFGTADAEFGVIRVLRRSPVFRECQAGARAGLACIADFECPTSSCVAARCTGGANDGKLCSGDGACPGGECGSSLFDFSDRYSSGGTGPVLVSSAEYDAEALNPVAIDGLATNDDLFSFVRSELLENEDINQDGDMVDDTVVVLQSADDSSQIEIGWTPGAPGRASARVRDGLFRLPALEIEGEFAAFLESEFGTDNQTQGQNRAAEGSGNSWDRLDQILRVFSVDGSTATQLTATNPFDGLAVETTPQVNGKALEISDGLVFFRESELAGAGWSQFGLGSIRENIRFSRDLRHVFGSTFAGGTCNVTATDLWVRDRDPDEDGLFFFGTEAMVSVSSAGVAGDGWHVPGNISASGRWLTFSANSTNLVPGSNSGNWHAYLHDRDADADGIFDEPGAIATLRVDVDSAGVPSSGDPSCAPGVATLGVSADGRWVGFTSSANDLVPGDLDGDLDFFFHDRDADADGILDEPGAVATFRAEDVTPGGVQVLPAAMSSDARFLVFGTTDALVAGDDNDVEDVFVWDRDVDEDGIFDEPGATSIVSPSVATGNIQTTRAAGISDDGRIVLGQGFPKGFAVVYDRDGDENGVFDEPGTIAQEVPPLERAGIEYPTAEISPDGRYLLLLPTVFGAFGTTFQPQILDRTTFAHGKIPYDLDPDFVTDGGAIAARAQAVAYREQGASPVLRYAKQGTSNDLNGDGDMRDHVLAVGDATGGAPLAVTYLTAAGQTAVAEGNALYLAPEADIAGGTDLNGDADADDRVVHLWRNRQAGPAVNLGLAAERVAVSGQVVAALASEAGEGALLNGDADLDDLVVHVSDLATATAGNWTNLFVAADEVQAAGSYVAFTVPEWSQGQSLNGDGDQDDRVLRVYDLATDAYVAFQDAQAVPIPGLAVDDFLLTEGVAAFRVNEFDQGTNLNAAIPPIPGGVADGDLLDSVIHVVDLATGTVYNGMQAAIPCPVEACDPRVPYRLVGTQVTFLTLEAEQGGNDLDQSGDGGTGMVLQHFNPVALAAGGSMQDACDVLSGALAGICTGTAESCASKDDCTGGGTCYFPPGGCLLDLATPCDPTDAMACTGDEICIPLLGQPGSGTCHAFQGPCLDDGQCTGGAFCTDNGADPEQLFASLAESEDGRQRYVSLGRCSDGDGSCSNDADCNDGATCDREQTVVATAADADGDGLADPIDNCGDVSNGDQLDLDGDGAGDACDRQTCGNGIQESVETCDHGVQNGSDGVCDADCVYVGAGVACNDGIDNDGDGLVDFAGMDPGCADAADPSERDTALPCDDGMDNDGDHGVDVGGDLGCKEADWPREDPACSDGLDNDGDGTVDYDGAGYTEPDSFCNGQPHRVNEKKKGCGLGPELALLLPLLGHLRRRRSAPRP